MTVFFYGCITMDGYLADKNHRLDWLYDTGGVEETDYKAFYSEIDVTIMGKRTFDEIVENPDVESFYPTSKNYVFTHAKELPAKSYIPIKGDVVSFVKQIDPTKNVWIVGGSALLAPLLDENLVDRLVIQIAPVLLGEGVPLFTQKEALKRFTLVEVKQFGPFAELVYEKL